MWMELESCQGKSRTEATKEATAAAGMPEGYKARPHAVPDTEPEVEYKLLHLHTWGDLAGPPFPKP